MVSPAKTEEGKSGVIGLLKCPRCFKTLAIMRSDKDPRWALCCPCCNLSPIISHDSLEVVMEAWLGDAQEQYDKKYGLARMNDPQIYKYLEELKNGATFDLLKEGKILFTGRFKKE